MTMMLFMVGQTSFVLMVPMEYIVQVFSNNLTIFSVASAILNWLLDWIVSELARYSATRYDLFKLVSITFFPLQKNVSLR